MAIAERLEREGFPPPKELRDRPRLDMEQRYLAQQFMVLHRTRGMGLNGPDPITLQACSSFLEFWPQWDALKFVETMLVADQVLTRLINEHNADKKGS